MPKQGYWKAMTLALVAVEAATQPTCFEMQQFSLRIWLIHTVPFGGGEKNNCLYDLNVAVTPMLIFLDAALKFTHKPNLRKHTCTCTVVCQ